MHRELAERLCRRFNEEWPVGSIVCYVDEDEDFERVSATRSPAFVLPSGAAVIELRDQVLACELERIVPMSRPDDFGAGIVEECVSSRASSERELRFPDRHKEK